LNVFDEQTTPRSADRRRKAERTRPRPDEGGPGAMKEAAGKMMRSTGTACRRVPACVPPENWENESKIWSALTV